MQISHKKKLEYIQLWKESGLSKAAFCRQMDIRYSSFMAWIYNYERKEKIISAHKHEVTTQQQIVAVSITGTDTRPECAPCLIIHLKDALLEIPPGFPSEEAENIIKTLRA